MYNILRAILFWFDPEKVHYTSMNGLKAICRFPLISRLISAAYKPGSGHQYSTLNLQFSNRIGLGAGFDKNALYLRSLEALGFGFVEVGTVTPVPQKGNEKPRLFRLPKDKALINRMGFNNDGVQIITARLKKWREDQIKIKNRKPGLIIGGNIGKNKSTPNEDAWRDYETCFTALHDYVDYFVVNVSSPNTAGLRALQEKDALAKILANLQSLNAKRINPKPILLKIAPDLTIEQLDDIIDLSLEIALDGLIVSNTTISRNGLLTDKAEINKIGAGGLSGLPVKKRSTEIIRYISNKTNRKILIIGSGGIFTGEDASEKIQAGASLVQVWTGFVYEGPAIVKKISSYLASEK
ncbi:MAG: quinone-dependent dihydroorotate dehydrogenase [Ferruginibacter sp.]|nr:quinone-dependent dihydroorotate dehydrogenase [Ferruginibacter sp.]